MMLRKKVEGTSWLIILGYLSLDVLHMNRKANLKITLFRGYVLENDVIWFQMAMISTRVCHKPAMLPLFCDSGMGWKSTEPLI